MTFSKLNSAPRHGAPRAPRAPKASIARDGFSFAVDKDFYKSELWLSLRKQALSRDGYKCRKCGKDYELNVHHIRSRSRGGEDALGNLLTLCEDCHSDFHPHMRRRK